MVGWILPTKEDRSNLKKFLKNIDERVLTEKIWKTFFANLSRLQKDFKKRKLKVVFLNSDTSKWAYQYIYEEFAKHKNFEIQILITIRDDISHNKNLSINDMKFVEDNFNFFAKQGFNVAYSFDLAKRKQYSLSRFKPDIIFYEQPFNICKLHSVENTYKYAIPMYCSYGASITNGSNEYTTFAKRLIYFLDNYLIKQTLLEHGFKKNALVVCGHPKLDAYLKPINKQNIIWKTHNKKHVIYAPHYSFYNDSLLRFGTFDWNHNFFYNFAKEHTEIEFIIKPHSLLKESIVKYKLMSKEQMEMYFKQWEELPNAQIYEYGNYFDMFRTSDLLITDCNSFLYEYLPTKKPVIHIISKDSVGHNKFGEKITQGYYKVTNIDEIKKELDIVLLNNQDSKLQVREQIISDILIQPYGGIAKFIVEYATQLFSHKENIKVKRKLKPLQYLFSITNKNKTHKQICILGIRLNFHRNPKSSYPNKDKFKKLPLDENKIIFRTLNGGYSCNPKYIAEEIIRQNLPYKLVWVVNNNILNTIDSFPRDKIKLVFDNTIHEKLETATAKIIVDNERRVAYIRRGVYKKSKQIYIQTFHGSLGIKLSGPGRKDITDRDLDLARIDSTQIDYAISNGTHTNNFFKRLFFNHGTILEYGHPRNDIFFNNNGGGLRTKSAIILISQQIKRLFFMCPHGEMIKV